MIKIFPNIAELNNFAAKRFIEIGGDAIKQRNHFSVALSGGSTPKAFFKLLATENFRDRIEWKKVFFFFGDERNVAPDDAESNFRMANENLFAPLKINGENIYRWQTELGEPVLIAEDYENRLRDFFILADDEQPEFDLILLGMGADAHTASLFPHTPAIAEKQKIAVPNPVEKLDTTRLTLTFPAINHAREIIFLVAGADKAAALREVLRGDHQPEKFPSQGIAPVRGQLSWLLDKDAAQLLDINAA